MQAHPRRDYTSPAFVYPKPPAVRCVADPDGAAQWRARLQLPACPALSAPSKSVWRRASGWLELIAQDLLGTGNWRALPKKKGTLFALACDRTVYGAPLSLPFPLVVPSSLSAADALVRLAATLGSVEGQVLRDDYPPLRDLVHVLQCIGVGAGVLFVMVDQHCGWIAETATPHAAWLSRNAGWVTSVWGNTGRSALVRAAQGCRLLDKRGREVAV